MRFWFLKHFSVAEIANMSFLRFVLEVGILRYGLFCFVLHSIIMQLMFGWFSPMSWLKAGLAWIIGGFVFGIGMRLIVSRSRKGKNHVT